MTLAAVGLALAGAAVHAAWNLLLVRRADPQAATAVALLAGSAAWLPVALVSWDVRPAAWPFVVASAGVELVYFSLLAFAYRHASFSVIYPVGRGLAPVIVLAAGVVLIGQRASWAGTAGVLLVGLGVLLVRGIGEVRAPARDLGLGVAIAVSIAAYTLIDQEGVRHASVLPYLWLVMALPAVAYASTQLARVGLTALRAELSPATALAGVGIFGSYAFVLVALGLAPAAPVAAARESSVVMATVAAGVIGLEPVGARKITGSAAVALGVGLLAVAPAGL